MNNHQLIQFAIQQTTWTGNMTPDAYRIRSWMFEFYGRNNVPEMDEIRHYLTTVYDTEFTAMGMLSTAFPIYIVDIRAPLTKNVEQPPRYKHTKIGGCRQRKFHEFKEGDFE
jgi:hypothetical protein